MKRGIFLPGAFKGLSYLIPSNFDSLWNFNVWVEALNQVFFQLSVGQGCMVALGSYRLKNESIKKGTYMYFPLLDLEFQVWSSYVDSYVQWLFSLTLVISPMK